MRYENDLDANWYSVEIDKYVNFKDDRGISQNTFIERAYTAADCLVQAKLFFEASGINVLRIYPMPQHHTNYSQFYQLRELTKNQN